MEEDAAVTRVRSYIDAYNRFDIDLMMEQLHDEVEFRNYANAELTHQTVGATQLREQAEIAATMFSERKQTVVHLEHREGGVLASIKYSGVIASDLPNGMKKGDAIEVVGTSEFGFRDGKIISIVDRS